MHNGGCYSSIEKVSWTLTLYSNVFQLNAVRRCCILKEILWKLYKSQQYTIWCDVLWCDWDMENFSSWDRAREEMKRNSIQHSHSSISTSTQTIPLSNVSLRPFYPFPYHLAALLCFTKCFQTIWNMYQIWKKTFYFQTWYVVS